MKLLGFTVEPATDLNTLHVEPASTPIAVGLPQPFGAEIRVETVEQVVRLAPGRRECIGTLISARARMARIQPFPHGGINE